MTAIKVIFIISSMMSERFPEAAVERAQRVDSFNSRLGQFSLAPLYEVGDLGDHTKGEIEISRLGEVWRLGDGLSLVEVGTTNPDGSQGRFVTFFRERESLARQNLLVPFVTNAPGNLEVPDDVTPPDETVAGINAQLAQFNLRRLPTIVNSTSENIVGIDAVNDVNSRFFTVVVFDVRGADGEIRKKPMVFNANSASGVDGSVFAVFARLPQYGMETRVVLGEAYRQSQGKWLTETFRGFYSPRHGGEGGDLRTGIVNVPAIRRAFDELMDEAGIRDADEMKRVGRLKQDPQTDYIYPDFWLAEANIEEFGPQDMEASERIKMRDMSIGEFFAQIPNIEDPFTIAAFAKALLTRRQLRVNRRGLNSDERMVYRNMFRFQYGRHLTEFGRGTVDDLPLDTRLGRVAFNTGVARITPDIYTGVMDWGEYKQRVGTTDVSQTVLLHPAEALEAVEQGILDDILTITATIRALHSKGYLELANLR